MNLFQFPGNSEVKRNDKENQPLVKMTPVVYMLEGEINVGEGSKIAIEMMGNIYTGTLLSIKEKDSSGNIRKVIYTIHHLESGDPLKIGEAQFKYIVKNT